MTESVVGQDAAFFGIAIDITLIITATVSSLFALTIPYLYYIKKECREHPTVLIANISVLEAIANFNVILMAYSMYGFEHLLKINDVFHTLIFKVDILPDEDDFCLSNYYIYMFFQLLSISFHICYSIDLFITLKYPFYSGKKRRKIYYAFSFLFPVLTITNSISEAENICNVLELQSIYYIPMWFLITILVFVVVSLIIIALSFLTKKHQSDIRKSYIRQHRATLFLLVLLWACPIWANVKIHFLNIITDQFSPINILAFFSIVSSSGIITMARIIFDPYIRNRIMTLFRCQSKKPKRSQNSLITSSQQYIELPVEEVLHDQIWNLPLSGAMSEFQSQEVVHNIIQVVCEACASHHRVEGRQSTFRDSVNSQNFAYESIIRNTVHIERQSESTEQTLLDLLLKERREQLLAGKDPNECDIAELKELCKRKRKYNMICTTHSKVCNNESMRLKQKTVKIKSEVGPNDDFEEVSTLDIKVTSYSHRVFEALRLNEGFTPEEIERSLDLQKNIPQIKKAKESLGASGSFFFFSSDNNLVIKTIKEEEKEKMIEILPEYFEHLKYNNQSLLAKIYGIFSIEIESISKIYFLMMENTLKHFKDNNLEYRVYDLKGSTIQRQVKDVDAPVFKDINYFRSSDCFLFMTSENKVRFIDLIQKDLEMLKQFNIMDYSLLLAVGKSKSKKKAKVATLSEMDLKFINDYRYIQELESISRKIYCVGIIDFLQEFNFQKKMELWLKKVFKGGGDISSVDTEIYFNRFMNFIKRITVTMRFPKNLKPMRVTSMKSSSKGSRDKDD